MDPCLPGRSHWQHPHAATRASHSHPADAPPAVCAIPRRAAPFQHEKRRNRVRPARVRDSYLAVLAPFQYVRAGRCSEDLVAWPTSRGSPRHSAAQRGHCSAPSLATSKGQSNLTPTTVPVRARLAQAIQRSRPVPVTSRAEHWGQRAVRRKNPAARSSGHSWDSAGVAASQRGPRAEGRGQPGRLANLARRVTRNILPSRELLVVAVRAEPARVILVDCEAIPAEQSHPPTIARAYLRRRAYYPRPAAPAGLSARMAKR